MVDRDRILAKLDELNGTLGELRSVVPSTFEEFLTVEKRRSCERLLQVSIEAVIDTCALLVSGLRLGLPGDEDDLFVKLADRSVISRPMADVLRRMKGMRNVLVHEYGRVDNAMPWSSRPWPTASVISGRSSARSWTSCDMGDSPCLKSGP